MKKLVAAALSLTLGLAATAFAATPPTNAKYGGHCAWGLTKGQAVPTTCEVTWTEPTSHATYCFLNEQNKAEFAKNIPTNVGLADAEFAKIDASKQATAALGNAQQQLNAAAKTVNEAQNTMNAAQGMMGTK